MEQGAFSIGSIIGSVLFFPTFFQKSVMEYVWGAGDPLGLALAKRVFLLLPTGAALICLWVSILCLLTVVVRQKRVEFLKAFFVTWWDFMKSVFAYWGGFFKFLVVFASALYGLARIMVLGTWFILQDILLVPFRLIRSVAKSAATPGVPWIAVVLTFFWCLVEALVFTYVMTPLVMDTLANLTGGELSEGLIRIPLFLFMLFLILGSYAVLAAWTGALSTRNIPTILKISAVEGVAAFVEVLFLYRELVDSLVPWFAQHTSKDFDLGMGATLGIGFVAWLGVRGMTWFLFASHGVPIITAIIQGTGLKKPEGGEKANMGDVFAYTMGFYYHFKADAEWVREKADELLGAFLLPPLQVVSATVNFFILLIASRHLFDLPFKSFRDIMRSRELMEAKPANLTAKGKKHPRPPKLAVVPDTTPTEARP
ncbi:MAG TPA: hypothetical protein VMV05_06630 [bacterium]|nr:hypothetical protein [bacterium]